MHSRDRQLAEAADLAEFLVVDGDPNASRLLRDDHQWARIRRSRVLDPARSEALVQGSVNFLDHIGVGIVGPGSDRRAAFRDRNLERHQGAGTKIRLERGENVSLIVDNTTQLFDC